jgi:hypothetical protein
VSRIPGDPLHIGCCISGHGFGHACRAIAVLQALARRIDIRCTILTSVPAWLFSSSLDIPHTVHPLVTDIGLIQHDALAADLPATLQALDGLYPLRDHQVDQAAALFAGCKLVLCDIAPLGIAAARRAGIPSVLVENFTWDWIYQGYVRQCPQLQTHIEDLARLFAQADHRIQAEPVCRTVPGTLRVAPIARCLHRPGHIRRRLYCEPGQRLVLLTMGGIFSSGGPLVDPALLARCREAVFVLIGKNREDEFSQNLRFLATDGPWYHPDLVAAADLVVGKTGYSTVAEAYQGNTAYAYLARPDFRESEVLEAFLDSHLLSWEITREQLESSQWLALLAQLPTEKKPPVRTVDGAGQVADFLVELLIREDPCRSMG